jgi:hypothetical protein
MSCSLSLLEQAAQHIAQLARAALLLPCAVDFLGVDLSW